VSVRKVKGVIAAGLYELSVPYCLPCLTPLECPDGVAILMCGSTKVGTMTTLMLSVIDSQPQSRQELGQSNSSLEANDRARASHT
jgi:hypothetical protein